MNKDEVLGSRPFLNDIWVISEKFKFEWSSTGAMNLTSDHLDDKIYSVIANVKTKWDILYLAAEIERGSNFVEVSSKIGEIYLPVIRREIDFSKWKVQLHYRSHVFFTNKGVPAAYFETWKNYCEDYVVHDLFHIGNLVGKPVWKNNELIGVEVEEYNFKAVLEFDEAISIETIREFRQSFQTAYLGLRQLLSEGREE